MVKLQLGLFKKQEKMLIIHNNSLLELLHKLLFH